MVLFATPLLWVLTRRLDRAARAREHLLRAAVEASDAERRRIARDLHDGVVQDLAGTAFALSATARDASTEPHTADRLRPLAGSLRKSLRSLRSLLVEIYPPDLDAQNLPAALDDLVAPAAGVSVLATVRVGEVGSASREAVALVWRVAQEAVRNALRHSHCRNLSVDVDRIDDRLVLRVSDDGVGISGADSGPAYRFGLRGLHDLVRESGGTLDIDSAPGRGTSVQVEVTAR
jgi:two-component system NarL family sensor kinase